MNITNFRRMIQVLKQYMQKSNQMSLVFYEDSIKSEIKIPLAYQKEILDNIVEVFEKEIDWEELKSV